ncbi:MAG: TonB box-like [Alphaproteobacteria bacterium]|nr:TonB box-like [Alphaproteobacteria bacterium]
MIQPGQTWRHYKGTIYRILTLARHSETAEEMVVYQDIAAPEKIWVRPKMMFLESVNNNGAGVPRFTPEREEPAIIS